MFLKRCGMSGRSCGLVEEPVAALVLATDRRRWADLYRSNEITIEFSCDMMGARASAISVPCSTLPLILPRDKGRLRASIMASYTPLAPIDIDRAHWRWCILLTVSVDVIYPQICLNVLQ